MSDAKYNANRFALCAAAIGLALTSVAAVAEDHPYTEGAVVSVSGVRTEYGRFDDYMKFLDTTWKQAEEAAKKAGLIVSYQVLQTLPRGPDDPDIYLVVTYKNWAAMDGLRDKTEAILAQVYGSVHAAEQGAVDRGKIRRTLGGQMMQVLELK
jgi:hypothetical protein